MRNIVSALTKMFREDLVPELISCCNIKNNFSNDDQTQGFPAEHCPKHYSASSDLLSVHIALCCHVELRCIKELWLLNQALSKPAHWLPGLTHVYIDSKSI